MKFFTLLFTVSLAVACSVKLKAQAISESFTDITTLSGSGWVMNNLSTPVGTAPNWFQGAVGVFAANTPTGYIGANFNNVTGANTISNWLITPSRTLKNGDVISFYTKSRQNFADRLQVCMSTNGTSTNVGTTNASVGDFTNLLMDINSSLAATGYPNTWTQYSYTVTGLSGPTGGRFAFRYYLASGGPTGTDSDYIGIDDFVYTPVATCTTTPFAGTITGPSTATVGAGYSWTVSPTTGNVQWYVSTSASHTSTLNAIPGTTTAITPTLYPNSAGPAYLTVIASSPGCVSDTSNSYFPVNVIYPGDDVCNATPLALGTSTVQYSVFGASTQIGEVVPPSTGTPSWGNSNLDNTRWFTFVAPASGHVSVQSPDFDTQLAIWQASSCGGLLSPTTAVLISASDDDQDYTTHGGVRYSSYLTAGCLTPGATYYIQLDSYDPAISTDMTRVIVLDLGTTGSPAFAGTISGPTAITTGSSYSWTITPTAGNLQWYASSSPSHTSALNVINNVTTAITPTIGPGMGGTFYLSVIASVPGCPSDTSNIYFQINATSSMPGDDVCSALPLSLGTSTVQYTVFGASTQVDEVAPPVATSTATTGWDDTTLNNTRWFTFVAPASGYVSVQSPDFDTKLAVWKASSCGDLQSATSTATFIAGNDDDANYIAHGGVHFSSYVKAACLTPGATYYIQLDSYDPAVSGNMTRVIILDMGAPLNTSFTGLSSNYCIGASNTTTFTPAVSGGVFTVNSNTTVVTSFSISSVGTSTVTYSIYGCKTNSFVTVNALPVVTANATSNAVCSGGQTTLTGGGASSYTWTGGINNGVAFTPTNSATYTVTGTSASGCVNTATTLISVVSTPTVTASASNPVICEGSTTTLNAAGATTYTWTGGAVNGTPFSPLVTASYTVSANASGCPGTYTAVTTVTVNPAPYVEANSNSVLLCVGQTAALTLNGTAISYSLNTITTSTSVVISPTTTTTYTISGTGSNGCSSVIMFTQNVSVCTGVTTLSKSDENYFAAYPNPNNGSFSVKSAKEQVVTITNELGQVIRTIELTSASNYEASVNGLVSGIYFIMTPSVKYKLVVTQ